MGRKAAEDGPTAEAMRAAALGAVEAGETEGQRMAREGLPLGSVVFGPPGTGQGMGAEVARVRLLGPGDSLHIPLIGEGRLEPLPGTDYEGPVREASPEWIGNVWSQGRTLQLGCGRRPMMGADNHSLPAPPGVSMPYVNYVRDLDRMPWGEAYEGGDALPQGVYDCVVGLDLLEHVEDVLGFMVECALLLRPGGLLVLRYGASDNPASYTDPTHKHWLTEESLTFCCEGTRLGGHYGAFYVDSLGRGILRYELQSVGRSNPDPRWPEQGDWLALLRKLE